MTQKPPYPAADAVVSVGIGLILTLLTCGLYYFYWQYKQMEVLNAWLERKEYDFMTYLLLTLITCGLFTIYYEYKMAQGINEVQQRSGLLVNENLALICLLLSIFGLPAISCAVQQADINRFYGANPDL